MRTSRPAVVRLTPLERASQNENDGVQSCATRQRCRCVPLVSSCESYDLLYMFALQRLWPVPRPRPIAAAPTDVRGERPTLQLSELITYLTLMARHRASQLLASW